MKKIDVAYIIPEILEGSGGARNIFRSAYHLANEGHSVCFYCKSDQDVEQLKKDVCKWYYDLSQCDFSHYSGIIKEHDVGIATFFDTAFSLKYNISKVRVPFYFVQDYEPLFYPMSTDYILAESTYQMGFVHICSGPWCKRLIEERHNAIAEYFMFPIDRSVYHIDNSVCRKRKRIIFFAKPEMPRRCYELGISCLKKVHQKRSDIEIILFGSNKLSKKDIGFEAKCFGLVPSLEELACLYRSASLGIVFSTTNPSLVPYEMIMCGCPVCDLRIGDALSKYGDNKNNVFLLELQTDQMSEQIIEILEDNDRREKVALSAYNWVDSEFPSEKEMGKKFEGIILKYLGNTIRD